MKFRKFISTFLVWVITAIAVAMMIFTIVASSTFGQTDRSLFGYKFFIVLSDSMKATDFAAGDLALVKEVDPATLEEGDIIAFISQNTDSFGQIITHKIRRTATDSTGEPGFVTYGTTTDTDDAAVVTYPYILGKYQSHIPKIGHFFQFLKSTAGYFLCIFLPFMTIIAVEVGRCVSIYRKYRRQQQAQLQAEREKIDAQRAEAELLMQQALALKLAIETPNGRDESDLTTDAVIK